MELLQIDRLCIDYGAVRAVDEVSLTVGEGEIVGLAGESGSGKSTLVHGLLRLLEAPAAITGGRVLWRGRDILDFDDAQLRAFRWREISLVMQSAMNALNPVLTVGAQIADVIEAHDGATRRSADVRVGELLELVGIDPRRARSYPHELSGGMRQRAVIAMALALRPSLVIMDEPTTALDVVVQQEILVEVARLQRELGFSILFITHDLALMLQLCHRVGVLYAGRLAELAPARELLDSPRHPYTRALMQSFPHAGAAAALEAIPGAPPDMRAPPPGCRFHPRCAEAVAACRAEQPALRALGRDRSAACHVVTP